MQYRCRVFLRRSADPLFDDGDSLLDGLIADREVIPVGSVDLIIVVFLKEIPNELISGQAVYSHRTVLRNNYYVRGLIKFIPFWSHKFFKNICTGSKLVKVDQTGCLSNSLLVVVVTGQAELCAADTVTWDRVVIFPEMQIMIRLVNDREHTVLKRVNDLIAIHVVNGYLAGGVALDSKHLVKQDVIAVCSNLDHLVCTHFKVHDMDNTVSLG